MTPSGCRRRQAPPPARAVLRRLRSRSTSTSWNLSLRETLSASAQRSVSTDVRRGFRECKAEAKPGTSPGRVRLLLSVGEAVLGRQIARLQRLSGLLHYRWVGCECSDRASGKQLRDAG